jgi:hypothetical protein
VKAGLVALLATGLLLVGAPDYESRGQEKKKTGPTAVKVQVMLEKINVKGKHGFVTGTFRKTQPQGGLVISSKLVDIPLTQDAKIRIGKREGKLSDLKVSMSVTLQLVVDRGGLVVVGIQTIGKQTGQKPKGEKP